MAAAVPRLPALAPLPTLSVALPGALRSTQNPRPEPLRRRRRRRDPRLPSAAFPRGPPPSHVRCVGAGAIPAEQPLGAASCSPSVTRPLPPGNGRRRQAPSAPPPARLLRSFRRVPAAMPARPAPLPAGSGGGAATGWRAGAGSRGAAAVRAAAEVPSPPLCASSSLPHAEGAVGGDNPPAASRLRGGPALRGASDKLLFSAASLGSAPASRPWRRG